MNTRCLSIFEVDGAFAIPVLNFKRSLAPAKRRDVDHRGNENREQYS